MILRYLYLIFENDLNSTKQHNASSSSCLFYQLSKKVSLQQQIVNCVFGCLESEQKNDPISEKSILLHCYLELLIKLEIDNEMPGGCNMRLLVKKFASLSFALQEKFL